MIGISGIGCASNPERNKREALLQTILSEPLKPLVEKEPPKTLAYMFSEDKDKKAEPKNIVYKSLTLEEELKKLEERPRDFYIFDFEVDQDSRRTLTKSEAKREGILQLTGIVEQKVRNIPIIAELTGWIFDTGHFIYGGVTQLERMDFFREYGMEVRNKFSAEGIQRIGLSTKITVPWKFNRREGNFFVNGAVGTNIDVMDSSPKVETFKGFSDDKHNQTGWAVMVGFTIYLENAKKDHTYGIKKPYGY